MRKTIITIIFLGMMLMVSILVHAWTYEYDFKTDPTAEAGWHCKNSSEAVSQMQYEWNSTDNTMTVRQGRYEPANQSTYCAVNISEIYDNPGSYFEVEGWWKTYHYNTAGAGMVFGASEHGHGHGDGGSNYFPSVEAYYYDSGNTVYMRNSNRTERAGISLGAGMGTTAIRRVRFFINEGNSSQTLIIDGVGNHSEQFNTTAVPSLSVIGALAYFGGSGQTQHWMLAKWYNLTITNEGPPTTIPIISEINCTSCNIPNGDITPPYTTSDATPTFSFRTDVNAYCAIGNQDQNYSSMGSSRNCTVGEDSLYHECVLTSQDELIPQTDYVHISCSNALNGNESQNSSSGPLEMNITNLISNIFCKSCNDSTEPYITSDTTPTFNFTTDMNASCRVGDEDLNYTDMGETRNCTTTGNMTHTCTLTVQDELITSTDYLYISCRNSEGEESNLTKKTLQMDITDLEVNASKSIDNGIQNSVIWPGATVYSDQQVYLRNLNDTQVLATVDRVAVYGNQRWILNYGNSSLGLFNITPVVYVLDMVNTPLSTIEDEVSSLINSTKN